MKRKCLVLIYAFIFPSTTITLLLTPNNQNKPTIKSMKKNIPLNNRCCETKVRKTIVFYLARCIPPTARCFWLSAFLPGGFFCKIKGNNVYSSQLGYERHQS